MKDKTNPKLKLDINETKKDLTFITLFAVTAFITITMLWYYNVGIDTVTTLIQKLSN